MNTLTIVAIPRGTTWVATGENCRAIESSPDKAIAKAKENYVNNVKTDWRWQGRVNELKAILKQPPIRVVATWDRVEVELLLERAT